ncbi:hypothetical protein BBJ28_00016802 [Nothophytophthora sp. Chile5]|nr:hypothetical protein BBJ28_00016802 [Nothophytophthora sp. Chile5]
MSSPAAGLQAGTNCTQPRVRKSWDAYSTTEKALYIEAVGLAMDQGFFQKFVQVHVDTTSGLEAHQTCVFMLWHRMMLLGYENMLRSLGTKYQCVTVPFWDHLSGTARRASGNCTNLQACSPIIADLGGTTTGYSKSMSIYGATIPYTSRSLCINQGPLYHFCGNNSGCAHCVLRTRSSYMTTTAYPTEASFGSVYQQMFTYNDSGSFSNAVERGLHSTYPKDCAYTIHNALGGVMAYLQAPADPVFYSHHALVDLLQTIYLKCQNGAENVFLSATAKSSDSRFWTSCARRDTGTFSPSDNITMRATAFDGSTFVKVWQDPKSILYPFFKDLPTAYADYVDAKDLGNYSYTYAFAGGLANMYQNCRASNTISSSSFLAESSETYGDSDAYKRNDAPLVPTVEAGTASDDTMRRWNIALFEAARIVGYEEWAAREQMEMITCQHQADCLGGVEDYSDIYRTNFEIEGHLRCYSIVQDLASGARVIGIPNWKVITGRFLPCPARCKATAQAPNPKLTMASMLRRTIWLAFVVLSLLNPSVDGQQVGTACSDPRVRKSWDAYTDTEKALYIEAVGLAMDQGFYQKFMQIHVETASGLEAHQTCVFIYWHRMLLLGFENMLRSLGTKYQCLTLPYWDHLSATARQANSNCSSIETCSPIITDFGGTTTGLSKSLLVYGVTIPYTTKTICVNQGLAYHFCGNNTGCAHCVLRTRSRYLTATLYPTEASFGSVYQQMFSYNDSASFSTAVERGIHNTVHNAVGGVMAYLQAPIDPVFYSHHALVDLLQTIYLKCQNGAESVFLSAASKASDPRFWTSCARRDTGTFSPSDNITMRATAFDGSTFVNVWQDPKNILYPFFKDLPTTYSAYVDAKDLGNYSYTYEFSGGLANMYQNCQASNTISSATLLADDQQMGDANYPDNGNKRSREPLRPTVDAGTTHDDVMRLWTIALFESARIVGYEEWAAREQMEMIACQHHTDCLGDVEDYSDIYRTNFGIEGHLRCYSIVQDLASGARVIGIPNWKVITGRFLPCPAQTGGKPLAFA